MRASACCRLRRRASVTIRSVPITCSMRSALRRAASIRSRAIWRSLMVRVLDRPHAGDQQDLHLAEPRTRGPRRAARHEGGAPRAQRIPPGRRQGSPARVLEDDVGGRRPADRHRGSGGRRHRGLPVGDSALRWRRGRCRHAGPFRASRSASDRWLRPGSGDPGGARGAGGARQARRGGPAGRGGERRSTGRLPRSRSDDGARILDAAFYDARPLAAARSAGGAARGDAAGGRR